MKLITVIGLVTAFLSLPLEAQVYSESAFTRSRHAAYANLGFTEGGFGLGAEYEYAAASTFGLGGYTRFYKKDTDRSIPGYFTFGAFIRPHFHRKAWDFYVSPGFGVISIDDRSDDETTFGPSLAIGLMYQIQGQIAIGIENMKHYVWFSDDYRGLRVNDFMLKGRVSF